MLSSPRSPDSTMRIFSSAVNCRPRRAPDLLHNLLCRSLNRPGFLPHLRSFNGYDGPEILVTCRPAGLILVTARWQARGRKIYGLESPQGSACPRLPFHRTRTVAWAAVEARLRKDGIGWMRWWWALMCQRIGSTWRC